MRITVGRFKQLVREAAQDHNEEKDMLIQVYSDVYKEKNGIRPRWMYEELAQMSNRDIEAEIEKLQDEPGSVDWEGELAPEDPGMEGGVSHEEMMSVDPMEDLPSRGPMHPGREPGRHVGSRGVGSKVSGRHKPVWEK